MKIDNYYLYLPDFLEERCVVFYCTKVDDKSYYYDIYNDFILYRKNYYYNKQNFRLDRCKPLGKALKIAKVLYGKI